MKFGYQALKFVLMISLVCLISLTVEASVPAIQITPSRFELLVEPRGKNVQTIRISNMYNEDLKLVVTTHDWDMSEEGGLILHEPGGTEKSASSWVRFNPKKFTVAPGKTQFVRFSVSVPPNVEPGEYRTSFVMVTEDKYKMEDGFYLRPTFAILVYVNVPAINRTGEVTDVKVTTSENGFYFLEGQIHSTGNAHLRITGEYVLKNSQGKEVKNEEIGKKLILPDRRDSFKINLGDLVESDTYSVKLIWHYLPAFYMEGQLDEYSEGLEGIVEEFSFTL